MCTKRPVGWHGRRADYLLSGRITQSVGQRLLFGDAFAEDETAGSGACVDASPPSLSLSDSDSCWAAAPSAFSWFRRLITANKSASESCFALFLRRLRRLSALRSSRARDFLSSRSFFCCALSEEMAPRMLCPGSGAGPLELAAVGSPLTGSTRARVVSSAAVGAGSTRASPSMKAAWEDDPGASAAAATEAVMDPSSSAMAPAVWQGLQERAGLEHSYCEVARTMDGLHANWRRRADGPVGGRAARPPERFPSRTSPRQETIRPAAAHGVPGRLRSRRPVLEFPLGPGALPAPIPASPKCAKRRGSGLPSTHSRRKPYANGSRS